MKCFTLISSYPESSKFSMYFTLMTHLNYSKFSLEIFDLYLDLIKFTVEEVKLTYPNCSKHTFWDKFLEKELVDQRFNLKFW